MQNKAPGKGGVAERGILENVLLIWEYNHGLSLTYRVSQRYTVFTVKDWLN
jgi:hypothetical protein